MSARGFTLWLLGPTSSGKTTLGAHITRRLREARVPAIYHDGDDIRSFFGPAFGFAPTDRLRVVSELVHLANQATEVGLNAIVSALTAHEEARRYVKENVNNLILAYLRCSIVVCIQRDSRGLHEKARRGKIDPANMIGFKTPYHAPPDPDIVLDTELHAPEVLCDVVETYLARNGYDLPSLETGARR